MCRDAGERHPLRTIPTQDVDRTRLLLVHDIMEVELRRIDCERRIRRVRIGVAPLQTSVRLRQRIKPAAAPFGISANVHHAVVTCFTS